VDVLPIRVAERQGRQLAVGEGEVPHGEWRSSETFFPAGVVGAGREWMQEGGGRAEPFRSFGACSMVASGPFGW